MGLIMKTSSIKCSYIVINIYHTCYEEYKNIYQRSNYNKCRRLGIIIKVEDSDYSWSTLGGRIKYSDIILHIWILILIINYIHHMTEMSENIAKDKIETHNLFFNMDIIRSGIQDIDN